MNDMNDMNWLADAVRECLDFGEKNGFPNFVAGTHALIDAYERDLRAQARQIHPAVLHRLNNQVGSDLQRSNIVSFPVRGIYAVA